MRRFLLLLAAGAIITPTSFCVAGDTPLSMSVNATRAPRGTDTQITATLRNEGLIAIAAVDVPVALTVSAANLPPRLVAVRNTGTDQRARFTWRVPTSPFIDNVTATCTTGGAIFRVTVASTRIPIG